MLPQYKELTSLYNSPLLTICSGLLERSFSTSSRLKGRTHVDWKAKGDVAVVRVNEPNSVMNTWTSHMQKDMMEVMDEIWTTDSVGSAVVISTKPHCFITGMDLKTIKSCKTEEEATLLSRQWQGMMKKIECSPKPIVAAISGWCLDGGLEFATACQYRLATGGDMTSLVSREVRMGLMPSAGGTQRLTELVGPYHALQIMLEGHRIQADAAKKMGLVHKVVDTTDHKYFEDVAVSCARGIVKKSIPLTPQKEWSKIAHDFYYSFPKVRQDMYRNTWNTVISKETFCSAPLKIIETVRIGVEQGSAAGYRAESWKFGELVTNDVTSALIRLFRNLTIMHLKKRQQ
uniref:enoyl-CoA hydratase n=1 Tax=Astyanax mexicanus TaxID=7994 RepID=A0A8B9JX15_ASTMX